MIVNEFEMKSAFNDERLQETVNVVRYSFIYGRENSEEGNKKKVGGGELVKKKNYA